MAATMNRAHLHILSVIDEVGGHCDLDMWGRLVAPRTKAPIPGDSPAILVLVANGYLAGEGGLIIMTEIGRQAVHEYRIGRVREAIG